MNPATIVSLAPRFILVAEDNNLDRLILQQAFDEIGLDIQLRFVTHGEELLDYLHRREAYKELPNEAWPAIVMMDLNMPRMNGHEALRYMRADDHLRMLPVMILSTSDNQHQIALAYANGANAFMTKPGHFDDLVNLIRNFTAFWLENSHLPALSFAA